MMEWLKKSFKKNAKPLSADKPWLIERPWEGCVRSESPLLESNQNGTGLRNQNIMESLGGVNQVNTGYDYERFVMFCVKEAGYRCEQVGQSGDYGADLVVKVNGKLLIIQCKYHSSPVGYDAVQEVYTAKSIYNGEWCCVVSNTSFTRQAKTGAMRLGVKLLSHLDLLEYLHSLM